MSWWINSLISSKHRKSCHLTTPNSYFSSYSTLIKTKSWYFKDTCFYLQKNQEASSCSVLILFYCSIDLSGIEKESNWKRWLWTGNWNHLGSLRFYNCQWFENDHWRAMVRNANSFQNLTWLDLGNILNLMKTLTR